MYSRFGAILYLLAPLQFTSCGAISSSEQNVQAVDLLHFNGQNETWAYRIDSVGRVQALHLNIDAPDSAVYCFTLSESQRRQVLTLAEEMVRLDSLGTGGLIIQPTDMAIAKVIVYRKGQPLFSYSNYPVPEYADPTDRLFHLAHALHEAAALYYNQSPCTGPFSAPVLAQGLEDLFHFPRLQTLPAGTAQE